MNLGDTPKPSAKGLRPSALPLLRQTLRTLLRFACVLLISTILLFSKDSLSLSPVEELAGAHLYSLAQWELENFLDKWLYRARLLLPGNDLGAQAKTDLVLEYFRLGGQEGELERRIEGAASSFSTGGNESLDALEEELARVERARGNMRNRVEEVLEGEIDAVIAQEKIPLGGPIGFLGVHFPPVDFRFDSSPRVLVVSPRDRIEMTQGILLRPDITLEEMESLERRVMEEENLSALVEGTGGVATYPSVISQGYSLRDALATAAHEWLHHYLFFRPLGQTYGESAEMTSLNETLAEIFGQEIGGLVYRRFYEAPVAPELSQQEGGPRLVGAEGGFDFRAEMRKTRLQVEQFLVEGKVEEAEQYMEQRRRLFAEQGYFIRKLNQAYFAFHGNYGGDPSSISPVYQQLSSLRAASPSLGEFVRRVSSVSSYADFLEMLDRAEDEGGR